MTKLGSVIRMNLILVVIASALGGLLVVGTVSYHYLEGWDWNESFYFTVCTLTTIGYGDLHPSTDASRLFTAFFAPSGVGVALASFGMLGTIYLRRGERILARMAEPDKKADEK